MKRIINNHQILVKISYMLVTLTRVCYKFHGFSAIVGLVIWYHRPFVVPNVFHVGISWVQNCSRWYFVVKDIFLGLFLWIQNFFSRGCFIGILLIYKWGIRINESYALASNNIEYITVKKNCFQFFNTFTST